MVSSKFSFESEVVGMLSLDRLDARILDLLAGDARRGVVELASTLGVARNTVQARIRRMEESGLLVGFRPDLDLIVAGIPVEAFIALTLVQGRLQSVVKALHEIAAVIEVHATTGREDLLVRVATYSHSSLQELIQTVVGIDGVSQSNTTLALTTPMRYRIQPLLNQVTQESGWGRATPAP